MGFNMNGMKGIFEMKKIGIAVAFLLAIGLAGCGEVVSISPGEVGKQNTSSGLEDDIRSSGTMRMDSCWGTALCPTIVKLQMTSESTEVKIDSVYLPKSNVDISNVRVGLQYRIRDDKASINRVFKEVRAVPSERSSRESVILSDKVWEVFGKRIVPSAIIDAIKDLNIDQMMNTGTELSAVVKQSVDRVMAGTPIVVTQLEIIDSDIPEDVIKAKRALFAIEDNKARQLKELETGVSIEERRQTFQRLRAKNDAEIAKQLDMTAAQYMCLKVAGQLADAAEDRGTTVFNSMDCGLGNSFSLEANAFKQMVK